MTKQRPTLPLGYSPLPPGHIANVVTFLEMTAKPDVPGDLPPGYSLARMYSADLPAYRAVFRKVGEDWLWFSRLGMPDEELALLLDDPLTEAYVLRYGDEDIGMLELDFREEGACEVVYFGLAPGVIGGGVGRALMEKAIALAWAKPIGRFWLHTCHFDHPKALGFYKHLGFRPYKFEVEVHPDPRLTGQLPRHVAPHIPLIG